MRWCILLSIRMTFILTTIQARGESQKLIRSPTQALSSLSPSTSGNILKYFSSIVEDASTKPILAYAGNMFEIKAKDNHIEIWTIFNTYATTPIDVMLYIKDGQYRDATYDMDEWVHVLNITVVGQGIGNPTYIPEGSFEPILIERGNRMSFYLVTTSGPILVCSKGNVERRAVDIYNPDLILYEGLGKRFQLMLDRSLHHVYLMV